MGTCDSVKRKPPKDIGTVTFIDRLETIDATEFYDVIVPIHSIKDITTGWKVKESERFKNDPEILKSEIAFRIGIIGNANKGKSFILSRLSKMDLPSGYIIKTEGLSIKYPDLKDYPNRRIILLDTAGLETPVLITNNEISKENSDDNNHQNPDISEEKKFIDLFKEKSREKIATELFLQDYIIYNSDILIIVVGILTYSEQKTINKIKYKIKKDKSLVKTNSFIYIIHNLKTFTTIKQVQTYVEETLLKSLTFQLEEQPTYDLNNEIKEGVCFYEKNSDPKIFHLIFANELSEAGQYYNQYSLQFIERLFGSNIGIRGFDIVETVKERFKAESKDIFEMSPDQKVEFYDNNIQGNEKYLIKLETPSSLTLKKIFIDELGIQNMKGNGFEPNYDCYITKDEIIINVEVPGLFSLNSSRYVMGEYNYIRISGTKIEDSKKEVRNNKIHKGREFGKFSLDIPINLEDYVIKNESPLFIRNNGVIVLIYKIEKILQTQTFINKDN